MPPWPVSPVRAGAGALPDDECGQFAPHVFAVRAIRLHRARCAAAPRRCLTARPTTWKAGARVARESFVYGLYERRLMAQIKAKKVPEHFIIFILIIKILIQLQVFNLQWHG